jgi:hypothetical protein
MTGTFALRVLIAVVGIKASLSRYVSLWAKVSTAPHFEATPGITRTLFGLCVSKELQAPDKDPWSVLDVKDKESPTPAC